MVNDDNVYAFSVSSYGVIYWRDRKRRSCRQSTAPQAQGMEPSDKKGGVPMVGPGPARHEGRGEGRLPPGELYHSYFVEADRERSMIWPDLIVLGRTVGRSRHTTAMCRTWVCRRVVDPGFPGLQRRARVRGHPPHCRGHRRAGGKQGVHSTPIRIGDLGATAASLMGLELRSTVIGQDLSRDLVS